MIPLVGTAEELRRQRGVVDRVASEVADHANVMIPYKVGTMIEVPRAAITADRIAEHAEFFSFGTNDLTQTTFGYSRDDAGRFLVHYVDSGILPRNPFVSIDREGVGELMRMAVEKGRSARQGLKVGICGEHGGDSAVGRFLPRPRPGLCVVLAVPHPGGSPCRGPGGLARARRRGAAHARAAEHPLQGAADILRGRIGVALPA